MLLSYIKRAIVDSNLDRFKTVYDITLRYVNIIFLLSIALLVINTIGIYSTMLLGVIFM